MAHDPVPAAPEVPLTVWRELLDAAVAFRAMRPWEWLGNNHVFALVDADERPWFSSVLGAGRQIYGLVFYRGVGGLRFVMMARQEDELDTRSAGFLQDALMLDWCGKKGLRPEDLDVLRRLGYAARPRERQGWPHFRDHTPGLFPWFLDAQGAIDLTRGLRATIATSELARTRPAFFEPCDETPSLMPTIDFETAIAGNLQPEHVEWRRWLVPAPDEPEAIRPGEDVKLLAQLPVRRDLRMEFDIVHTLTPVADGRRPYFPLLGLVADQRSGLIFSIEMREPGTPWSAHVQATWLKAMIEAQARPESLIVRRPEWLNPLRPLADAIGMKLRFQESLPAIEDFCASFDSEMR